MARNSIKLPVKLLTRYLKRTSVCWQFLAALTAGAAGLSSSPLLSLPSVPSEMNPSVWTTHSSASSLRKHFPRTFILDPESVFDPVLSNRFSGAQWKAEGPRGIFGGQVEGLEINGNPVAGGIQVLLPHPIDPDILYAGSVNGGVWKTTNSTAVFPNWHPLTDSHPSLSISSLVFDSSDPTFETVAYASSKVSSYGLSGPRGMIYRSRDGGLTWENLDPNGSLEGMPVSGIIVRRDTITVSVGESDNSDFSHQGIFRSVDGGENYQLISEENHNSGLSPGLSFGIAADPRNPKRLFTVMIQQLDAAKSGLYKSLDGGEHWSKAGPRDFSEFLARCYVSKIRLSMGYNDNLFLAIAQEGAMTGLFRLKSGIWTSMDVPKTIEGGSEIGLHPRPKPGGQGALHFSLCADPVDENIVHVGGDRQPGAVNDGGWPNSLGATNYTGRIFRVDASRPSGQQAVSQTHRPTTRNNSAPHADSRSLVFDAHGLLLEGDDGGIFYRTDPRGTNGDWFCKSGDLQVSELHSIDFDNISRVFIAGGQDIGTMEQPFPGSLVWQEVSQADGGVVAVDDISAASENRSYRFSSLQSFLLFRKVGYGPENEIESITFPALKFTGGNPGPWNFRQKFVLNQVDARRGLVGNATLYETFNHFETLVPVHSGGQFESFLSGGKLGGLSSPDLMVFGSGSNLFIRSEFQGEIRQLPGYTGGKPAGISVNPEDWRQIFVTDREHIFATSDLGESWTNITGNLKTIPPIESFDPGRFLALQYVPGPSGFLLAGTVRGVFVSGLDRPGVWYPLGTNFPNAFVYDLAYDAKADLLAVATMGRGAWSLRSVKKVLAGDFPLVVPVGKIVNVGPAASTMSFSYPLENKGTLRVTNLSVILSSTSPLLQVRAGNSTYPSLNPGETATNRSVFQIMLSPARECEDRAVIRCEFTADGISWVSDLDLSHLIPCKSGPVFEAGEPAFFLAQDQPDALFLAPGQTNVSIYLPIINRSRFPTTAAAVLHSSTPGIVVVQDKSDYPSVPPDDQRYNLVPFRISISDEHPCGTPILLRLELQAGSRTNQLEYAFEAGYVSAEITETSRKTTASKAIPEMNPLATTFEIPDAGMFVSARLRLDVTHPYVNDLLIELASPDGVSAVVFDGAFFEGSNFKGTTFDDAGFELEFGPPSFSGVFKPMEPFSRFSNAVVRGSWILKITDRAEMDSGFLNNAELTIVSRPFVCGNSAAYRTGPLRIDDRHGNGNGNLVPDPGETTVDLHLSFKNFGLETTTGSRLALSCQDPGVRVNAGEVIFPPILPGQTVENQTPFSISIDPLKKCGEVVLLDFEWSTSSGKMFFSEPLVIGLVENRTVHREIFPALDFGGVLHSNSVSASIPVELNESIVRLEVRAEVEHPRVGDLSLFLVDPEGRALLLFNRRGGNGTNLNIAFADSAPRHLLLGAAPFAGGFKPEEGLDFFAGHNSAGLWKLLVQDHNGTSPGVLKQFELLFTTENLVTNCGEIIAPSFSFLDSTGRLLTPGSELNLGRNPPGYHFDFRVTNQSATILLLSSFTVPSGLELKTMPARILPGESGLVRIAVPSGNSGKSFAGKLRFLANSFTQPVFEIDLKGEVGADLESIRSNKNQTALIVYGKPGRIFELQTSDTLQPVQWRTVTNLLISTNGRALFESSQTNDSQFFRTLPR